MTRFIFEAHTQGKNKTKRDSLDSTSYVLHSHWVWFEEQNQSISCWRCWHIRPNDWASASLLVLQYCGQTYFFRPFLWDIFLTQPEPQSTFITENCFRQFSQGQWRKMRGEKHCLWLKFTHVFPALSFSWFQLQNFFNCYIVDCHYEYMRNKAKLTDCKKGPTRPGWFNLCALPLHMKHSVRPVAGWKVHAYGSVLLMSITHTFFSLVMLSID